MSKKTKRLEKENETFRRKHDATNANIFRMAEEREGLKRRQDAAEKKGEKLMAIIRSMQQQGRKVPPSAAGVVEGYEGGGDGEAEAEAEGFEGSEYSGDEEEEGDEEEDEDDDDEDDEEDEEGESEEETVEREEKPRVFGPERPPQNHQPQPQAQPQAQPQPQARIATNGH